MLVGIVLSAWRWQEVLLVFDARVSLRTLTGHYLAGQFVGNVLPSTIGGDVVARRPLLEDHRLRTETAFASVVLERLSGILALPVLVVVGFAFEPSLLAGRPRVVRVAGRRHSRSRVLGLILFAAGHPGIAGRFADNENWTRFIGAVSHRGSIGSAATRAGSSASSIAALVYQVSIVGSYVFIFRALDADVPIAAALRVHPRGVDAAGASDIGRGARRA